MQSVQMLSAGQCEGGILGPTGGSVQEDQAVFCNALYHTKILGFFIERVVIFKISSLI